MYLVKYEDYDEIFFLPRDVGVVVLVSCCHRRSSENENCRPLEVWNMQDSSESLLIDEYAEQFCYNEVQILRRKLKPTKSPIKDLDKQEHVTLNE